jgi:hypothetical protein
LTRSHDETDAISAARVAYVARFDPNQQRRFHSRVVAAIEAGRAADAAAIARAEPEQTSLFVATGSVTAMDFGALLGRGASRPEAQAKAKPDDEEAEAPGVYSQADVMKAMALMQEGFAVVANAGSVEIIEFTKPGTLPKFYSQTDFRLLLKNQKVAVVQKVRGRIATKPVDVSELWLNFAQRNTFPGGVVFEPEAKKAPSGAYNLWSAYPVEPRSGRWDKLRTHVFENICGGNVDHFNWLMTWCADLFQNPGHKLGTCVAVRGPKGVGKSKFFDWLRAGMGAHALKVSQSIHLTGQFNSHHFGKTLIVAEEAFWAGAPAAGNVLKDLVTSTESYMERKGRDLITTSNYARLAFVSNEHWLVPTGLDDDERRFFVLECRDNGQKKSVPYFEAIDEEMENGGLEAMVYDLMHWQPPGGKWSMLRNAPATEARALQAIASLPADAQFFLEMIEAGGCAEDIRLGLPEIWLEDGENRVVVADLKKHFDAFWAKRKRGVDRYPNSHAFCELVKSWLHADGQGHSMYVETGSTDKNGDAVRRKMRVYKCLGISEIVALNRKRGVAFSGIAVDSGD